MILHGLCCAALLYYNEVLCDLICCVVLGGSGGQVGREEVGSKEGRCEEDEVRPLITGPLEVEVWERSQARPFPPSLTHSRSTQLSLWWPRSLKGESKGNKETEVDPYPAPLKFTHTRNIQLHFVVQVILERGF